MILGYSLSGIVHLLITFYMYLVFAYVVLSWFPVRGLLLDVYRVLASICEPWIGLFRRIVPTAQVGGGGLDFSPFVAIIALQIIGALVSRLLAGAGF